MKRTATMVAALSAAIAMAAFSGAAADDAISFTVSPVGSSGVTGSGAITHAPLATESLMTLQWQGLAPGSVHALTQYHGTACDARDAGAEFTFNAVTADSQGKASTAVTVKKPYANWPNRPHFSILHATAEPTSAAIACGTIVVAKPAEAPAATSAPTVSAPRAPSTGSGTSASTGGPGSATTVAGLGVALAGALVIGFGSRHRRHR